MYVNVPGQYNVVMKIKPKKSHYQRHDHEDFGILHPLTNDDSEDSFYTKKDENIPPIDEAYNVLYDEDDIQSDSGSNHSKESSAPNNSVHDDKNASNHGSDDDSNDHDSDNNDTNIDNEVSSK